MDAQRLTIVSRQREQPLLPLRPDDFLYGEGADVDARVVVEQPTISLYCLDHDHQRALFVETPPDVDLSAAPFYYQAQYEAAQQVIAVPYATLRQLADAIVIPADRLILVYSVGRCGSTLVSQALKHADGVCGFSEPDVFTQLVSLREADGSNAVTISDLTRDCTRVMCAAARSGGASAWALKFRSWGIELGDLLYQHFPEAKVVFLYRHADGFAASSARAFRIFEPDMAEALPHIQRLFSRLVPCIGRYSATHSTTIPPVEFLACMWASVMARCLDLQRLGVPMFCLRYEELKAAPQATLAAMFAYCGVTASRAAIDRVLAQDSQAGTALSQANAQASTSRLTTDQVAELGRLIRAYAPALTPNTLVPHTFSP